MDIGALYPVELRAQRSDYKDNKIGSKNSSPLFSNRYSQFDVAHRLVPGDGRDQKRYRTEIILFILKKIVKY
jgi:hypothetical protein